jgi:hypothetical protein
MTPRKEAYYNYAAMALALTLFAVLDAKASDQWVTSIQSSNEWAVFPCKDYIITNVCGTDKGYNDPGTLPPVISVGDTISYQDKDGKHKQFVVHHIRYYVYDNDVDFKYAGKQLTAKKGETSCNLYDVKNRASTRDSEYPSKIVIKGCRVIK